MTCARCGRPLDPDHACVQHEPGCDTEQFDCDCMNVCPDCCRVLGCPLQETPTMTNPTPRWMATGGDYGTAARRSSSSASAPVADSGEGT